MPTKKLLETNFTNCRKCGEKVVQMRNKKGKVFDASVYYGAEGYYLIRKNNRLVEHRC